MKEALFILITTLFFFYFLSHGNPSSHTFSVVPNCHVILPCSIHTIVMANGSAKSQSFFSRHNFIIVQSYPNRTETFLFSSFHEEISPCRKHIFFSGWRGCKLCRLQHHQLREERGRTTRLNRVLWILTTFDGF